MPELPRMPVGWWPQQMIVRATNATASGKVSDISIVIHPHDTAGEFHDKIDQLRRAVWNEMKEAERAQEVKAEPASV